LETTVTFPDAGYFIAASRLRPGLDGGYTVAILRRALDFEAYGGVLPVILTFDFWPEYPAIVDEFRAMGLANENTVMRNLYEDARHDSSFLRAAARPADTSAFTEGVSTIDHDSAGRAWRVTVADAAGTTQYTDYLDAAERPLLRLPYISGRADWHVADVAIEVLDHDGSVIGIIDGFGGLYRAWVDHVIAGAGFTKNIVVVEARQVGELLVAGHHDYAIVHTVHNAHTSPPYAWDSEMDLLWANWFAGVHQYDAVVWLTEAQRADAARRFGEGRNWVVVPHPAFALDERPAVADRDPHSVVMITRLAAQKRVEDAVSAWPVVIAAHPEAHLDIYGGGILRPEIDALISQLDVGQSVTVHGYVKNVQDALDSAAVLLLTSRFEGQSLAITEALAHGTPAVSYDVAYGPGELIEHGVSGYLVPPGDVAGISEALSSILGSTSEIDRMSLAGWEWARAHGPQRAMDTMTELFTSVLQNR
jgi:poly(glycerol-phosphate) alpha-glucosyltransferase